MLFPSWRVLKRLTPIWKLKPLTSTLTTLTTTPFLPRSRKQARKFSAARPFHRCCAGTPALPACAFLCTPLHTCCVCVYVCMYMYVCIERESPLPTPAIAFRVTCTPPRPAFSSFLSSFFSSSDFFQKFQCSDLLIIDNRCYPTAERGEKRRTTGQHAAQSKTTTTTTTTIV